MSVRDNAILQLRGALESAMDALKDVSTPLAVNARAHENVQDIAAACLKDLQVRARILRPELPDGAWAILLDLFVREGQHRVCVSDACIASGRPATTALRWIRKLTDLGLLVRYPDEVDGRRHYLELTSKAHAAILSYVTALR